MTIVITTSIRCDDCGYTETISDRTDKPDGAYTLAIARRKGWYRVFHQDRKMVDICPGCATGANRVMAAGPAIAPNLSIRGGGESAPF